MLKTIEDEMREAREMYPDITPELMQRPLVLTASLVFPEDASILEVKVVEIQKRRQEPEKDIECWCGKDTICSNCLKENQIRRSQGKNGLYFNGILCGADLKEKTK